MEARSAKVSMPDVEACLLSPGASAEDGWTNRCWARLFMGGEGIDDCAGTDAVKPPEF